MAWEWLAPVVTGSVGLAGIAGTVWVAAAGRRAQLDIVRIQAQSELRRRTAADKREIYAKVLHQLEDAVKSGADYRISKSALNSVRASRDALAREDPRRDNAQKAFNERESSHIEMQDAHRAALHDLHRLLAEMAVIAGPEMVLEAGKVTEVLGADDWNNTANYRKAVARLTRAMRHDLLGEA